LLSSESEVAVKTGLSWFGQRPRRRAYVYQQPRTRYQPRRMVVAQPVVNLKVMIERRAPEAGVLARVRLDVGKREGLPELLVTHARQQLGRAV